MKSLYKNFSILPLLGLVATAHAAPVSLNDWVETGADADNIFVGNGTAGFTETYGTETQDPARVDSGARANFASRVTLDNTLNTIQFSLTVGDITTVGGSNNAFRIGFENDDAGSASDATLHYVFGYGDPGTRVDARFAGSSNQNNEYGYGSAFDSANLGTNATKLATGNTVNLVATLTYLGDNGDGTHNYRAMIDWDGQMHTSNTFTRNTDSWDKVYVLTNSGAVNVANDTYTVSNVQVTTTSVDLSAIGLNNWVETGADVDNTFVGNGTDGFTETFGTNTNERVDSGARADFINDVLFTEPFEAIEFSLTVDDIIATGGTNGGFRIGFENDGANSATIHYAFGWGVPGGTEFSTRRDARFAGDSFTNNEYGFGPAFDANFQLGPPASLLSTGNTADITVTLTYIGDTGGGDYDYQATINWNGAKHTSGVFSRNTNSWDKVYVLTNRVDVNLPGDTYTVSNAQVRRIGSSPDFAAWASDIGLLGGPNGDDDGDDLINYDEYIFGLDPTLSSSFSPIVTPLSSTTGSFQYTRRNPSLYDTGLTYSYQYSTTLASGSWMSFTPVTDPPATDSGDPVETVTVDLPAALLAEPRLFVRVLAE